MKTPERQLGITIALTFLSVAVCVLGWMQTSTPAAFAASGPDGGRELREHTPSLGQLQGHWVEIAEANDRCSEPFELSLGRERKFDAVVPALCEGGEGICTRTTNGSYAYRVSEVEGEQRGELALHFADGKLPERSFTNARILRNGTLALFVGERAIYMRRVR